LPITVSDVNRLVISRSPVRLQKNPSVALKDALQAVRNEKGGDRYREVSEVRRLAELAQRVTKGQDRRCLSPKGGI